MLTSDQARLRRLQARDGGDAGSGAVLVGTGKRRPEPECGEPLDDHMKTQVGIAAGGGRGHPALFDAVADDDLVMSGFDFLRIPCGRVLPLGLVASDHPRGDGEHGGGRQMFESMNSVFRGLERPGGAGCFLAPSRVCSS